MSVSGVTARPLNPLYWLGAPMLICAAATILFALPVRIFGLQPPEPVFALAPAFAWAVIRPSILPPFALIVSGLFLDILWGGPIGLWPFCLLCAYAAALFSRQILIGQNYLALWVWYAGACAVAFAAGMLFMTLDTGAPPAIAGVGWQLLASAALFPFAHRLIERYEDADVRFR